MTQVVVMMGPSGAGKSTYVRENFPRAWVCAPDDFRIEGGKYVWRPTDVPDRLCFSRFKQGLRQREPVIVFDSTNGNPRRVKPYVRAALTEGYSLRFVVVGVDVTVDEMVARTTHEVPRSTIEAQLKNIAKLITNWPEHWPAPEYA